MPPIFFIKEKTEHYKQQLCELNTEDGTNTEPTEETIYFNNGMKAIVPFRLYYIWDPESNHQYDYTDLYFFGVSDMKLSMYDEEILDEKLKNSVYDYIQENYFDYSVFDIDE
jgi:hypothetical protein